ncbi:MAG: glutaredoxin family protein [Candidatus Methanoperedens sp.]|nr:glutaredoxin family protein [Candidatus Methanoperedens sp.]
MVNITIYSKNNCHLCDIAMETLLKIQKEFPFSLTEIDIEKDKEIFEKYKYLIPVIEIDGKKTFTYKVNEAELKTILKFKSQPQ